jgi:hypothetical protein
MKFRKLLLTSMLVLVAGLSTTQAADYASRGGRQKDGGN